MPAQVPANTTTVRSDYLGPLIERAAFDPEFKVEKLQALLDLKDTQEMREAEKQFNAALVQAQADMGPINADATNPQTRSKYATYAQLDRAIRPIYTRFGLAPSFNTEPMTEPDMIQIVGILSHRDGGARRYQIPMPRETKGARGGDVMTRTHATGSAFSYGKRYLLIGMFNLSIDIDDDGNAASRRQPYRPRPQPDVQTARSMDELIDVRTGEVVDHVDPFTIEMNEGSTWSQFIEPMQRYLLQSSTIAEWDQWMQLNGEILLKLKDTKPQLFRLFEKNTEAKHEELTNAMGTDAGRS